MSLTLNQGLKPYQESITHEIGSLKTMQGSKINKAKVINELKWHKFAYNLGHDVKNSASADVYFNHDDEDHGFFSWIMNSIYI